MKTRKTGHRRTKRLRKMKGGIFGSLFSSTPNIPQPVEIRKVYVEHTTRLPELYDVIHPMDDSRGNEMSWKINGGATIGTLHDIISGHVVNDITGNYVVYYINTDTIKKGEYYSDAPDSHPLSSLRNPDSSDITWVEMHIAKADEVNNFCNAMIQHLRKWNNQL